MSRSKVNDIDIPKCSGLIYYFIFYFNKNTVIYFIFRKYSNIKV